MRSDASLPDDLLLGAHPPVSAETVARVDSAGSLARRSFDFATRIVRHANGMAEQGATVLAIVTAIDALMPRVWRARGAFGPAGGFFSSGDLFAGTRAQYWALSALQPLPSQRISPFFSCMVPSRTGLSEYAQTIRPLHHLDDQAPRHALPSFRPVHLIRGSRQARCRGGGTGASEPPPSATDLDQRCSACGEALVTAARRCEECHVRAQSPLTGSLTVAACLVASVARLATQSLDPPCDPARWRVRRRDRAYGS